MEELKELILFFGGYVSFGDDPIKVKKTPHTPPTFIKNVSIFDNNERFNSLELSSIKQRLRWMKSQKQKRMTTEAIELLQDLKDYMNNRADVLDGGFDEGGTWHNIPNEEMTFEQRIDEVLRAATAATKAEVYSVMFDTTSNEES